MSAIHLSDSHYNICQFRAMCSLAFFAFLRVGEITASASGHTLQINQLTKLVNHKQEIVALKVTFSIQNTTTTSVLSLWRFLARIFVVQYSSYLNFCTSGVINLGLFSLCGMVALCQDLFFQRNFPFVLNIVDLILHGTRVTVFELGLLLMLQRGECPTRRSEL